MAMVRPPRLLLNVGRTIHEVLWQGHGARGLASGVGSQGRGPPIGSKPAVEGVQSIIAVASGKGGVGKSTTAGTGQTSCLPCLSMHRKKLPGSYLVRRLLTGCIILHQVSHNVFSCSKFGSGACCGVQAAGGFAGCRCLWAFHPQSDEASRAPSAGFSIKDDTNGELWCKVHVNGIPYGEGCSGCLERAHVAICDWQVMSALEKLVRGVGWGKLDVMVVDMPPGTGDAQISISQRLPLAGAVIVSTPQDIALIDARRGANMFRKVDVPILGLIENMSFFKCPKCGERCDVFGHGGAQTTAQEMDMEFLGEVPLNIAIRETSDAGSPIVAASPSSEVAMVYKAIAVRLAAKLQDWTSSGAGAGPKISVR